MGCQTKFEHVTIKLQNERCVMLMDFSVVPKRMEAVLEKAEYSPMIYSVEMGYDPEYLDEVVYGEKSPTLELIEKFCKLLKVDVMYLFGLIEYVDVEF